MPTPSGFSVVTNHREDARIHIAVEEVLDNLYGAAKEKSAIREALF